MAIGVQRHGSTYLTTSGAVGIAKGSSAEPKIIYSIHVISGATPSLVTLKDNGSSGTIYIQELGTANQGQTFNYPEGKFFPNDCYYTADGNQTSVLISYDELKA